MIAPPAVAALGNWPSQTLSAVGPKCVSPIVFFRSPASVLRSPPLVTVPEDFMLFNAAVTTHTQPESSPSLSMEGGRLPATPLTPSQAMVLAVVAESFEVMICVPCPLHSYCRTTRSVSFE